MARLTHEQFTHRIKACFAAHQRCKQRFHSTWIASFFANQQLDRAASYIVKQHIAARQEREARKIVDALSVCAVSSRIAPWK